jgi:hypothetical protein
VTDSALIHWRRNLAEIADAELFEVIANTFTSLLRELPRDTQDGQEICFMLEGLRDEALRRYATREHHSPEPRGNG